MVPEWESSEYRELSYGRYRVIYRIEPKQLSILTVRHSSRLLDPTELEPSGD
ncbi:MAG TPA: type II toxin-antitoxin system RelE/ParE family toxin [Thermoanaerobaculia bacterium]|nr:type II toxin-antitoxin system RelE/ParE family toxin [Thermoanaerobaculia bacterium]